MRHQFVSTSGDGQLMFWDTRFNEKEKRKMGLMPQKAQKEEKRPDYVPLLPSNLHRMLYGKPSSPYSSTDSIAVLWDAPKSGSQKMQKTVSSMEPPTRESYLQLAGQPKRANRPLEWSS